MGASPSGRRQTARTLILGTARRPTARLLSLIVCAVAVVSLAANAQPRSFSRPGAIRGRVALGRVAPATERRPTVAELGSPRDRDVIGRLKSVVYLETAPRGAFERTDAGRAVMDQRNEAFVPHVLAVTTGTIVGFPNNDPFYHNVFSLSKAGQFDLGRYANGKSQSVQFNRPGIVRVFCEIHSHMNAFILVFSHPFFAVTDEIGAYRLDNVPPGSYNVVAWNEGVTSQPRPVSVPEGAIAELDFALR